MPLDPCKKTLNLLARDRLCAPSTGSSRDYDYAVIGGGTAGLVVAVRIMENPSVKVGVIEAGQNRMDDKQISTPSSYPTLIGRPKYDWCMQSTPQPSAGKTYSMPRGKALGGSSAINYLMYVRGSRKDYNSWAELGNKGWGWDDLVPYFRKHQMLNIPDEKALLEDKQFMPHAAREKYHGGDGPIHTSFNDHYMPLEEDFCKAAYERGPYGILLVSCSSRSLIRSWKSILRCDWVSSTKSASEEPACFDGGLRHEDLFDEQGAAGVEFSHSRKLHVVKANKEVVLSAGVIQTPQLLELSDIGDPDVLQKAGVKCVIENKSVGANFQDHVLGGMLFTLLICLEHPLSRGSVHIASSDPMKPPIIDPGYLRHETDAKILATGLKWLDEVSKHFLVAKSLGDRVLPPPENTLETEEQRVEYVKNHISTQYHLMGVAAMGEVANDRLQVIDGKGQVIKGLRVVDASVFPGHVSGNIMSSTYTVAEKGADLIKQEDGQFGSEPGGGTARL
ncbi:GMC oxidoreductase [Karstenula rhodostoma CBS 690.94]|uniref:GMC oxidoreductase n=1 Tax=Karstenula rhodostoma CBS 690.94 TaxID=1392251 RepID=A0A9P4PNV1_9PLEO|nr:GMC oxidoreductase [Karstenula rhodostoma CBS 690.94]